MSRLVAATVVCVGLCVVHSFAAVSAADDVDSRRGKVYSDGVRITESVLSGIRANRIIDATPCVITVVSLPVVVPDIPSGMSVEVPLTGIIDTIDCVASIVPAQPEPVTESNVRSFTAWLDQTAIGPAFIVTREFSTGAEFIRKAARAQSDAFLGLSGRPFVVACLAGQLPLVDPVHGRVVANDDAFNNLCDWPQFVLACHQDAPVGPAPITDAATCRAGDLSFNGAAGSSIHAEIPAAFVQSAYVLASRSDFAPRPAAVMLFLSDPVLALKLAVPQITTTDLGNYVMVEKLNNMLINSVLDDVRIGRINKHNPAIRQQVIWYLAENPFSPTAYQVYQLLLESTAGNTGKKKMFGLRAWALQAENGRYADVMTYYTAYHAYRTMEYDVALGLIADYEKNHATHRDRVQMLKALCYTQKNRTSDAIKELEGVEKTYPDSPVLPEAMFMRAWLYIQSGDEAKGKTVMQDVISAYPESDSARKARQALAAVAEQEGQS